ncbi:hypothetical protein KKC94_05065 [Patescibacteria group bacterium]|nr:hypothetical protein [Patescibacteria group bacterium]
MKKIFYVVLFATTLLAACGEVESGTYVVDGADYLEMESLEVVPPVLTFSYEGKELKEVKIEVGHETWAKEFLYYFENSQLVKYEDKTIGRPDEPPTIVKYEEDDEMVLPVSVLLKEFKDRDGLTEEEFVQISAKY